MYNDRTKANFEVFFISSQNLNEDGGLPSRVRADPAKSCRCSCRGVKGRCVRRVLRECRASVTISALVCLLLPQPRQKGPFSSCLRSTEAMCGLYGTVRIHVTITLDHLNLKTIKTNKNRQTGLRLEEHLVLLYLSYGILNTGTYSAPLRTGQRSWFLRLKWTEI